MAIHTDDLSAIPEDLPEGKDRLVSGAAGNAEAIFEKALRPSNLTNTLVKPKRAPN
jgi:Holliday junction DNA helicase RuvB